MFEGQRQSLLRALLLLFLLAPHLAPSAAVAAERGMRGVLAMRGSRVLAAENAERLFVPASVNKLVVCIAALHYLGPEFRVSTSLAADGLVQNGTLNGDLVLRAAGDPTWNRRFFRDDPRRPLRALAGQLRAHGVRHVTGDLVVDLSRFPGRSYPASRPLAELALAYGAPTSGLAIDENTVAVEIAPGAGVGTPGTAHGAAGVELTNGMRTAPRQLHGRGTVEILPQWESDRILLRGEYPISEPPYAMQVSTPHPERRAAEAFRAVLRAEGINLAGDLRFTSEPAAPRAPVVATLRSPPLAEILPPILTDSQNWYAEMLLRLLAAELGSDGGRFSDALRLEKRFLEEVVGVAGDAFLLDDGSGLSPFNLLAPEAVVALLRFAWHQPWRRTFVDALSTANNGTLAAWPGLPAVAAKTGTLQHTIALAGYLQPQAAEPVVFACFLNHRTDSRPQLRAEIVALLRRWQGL